MSNGDTKSVTITVTGIVAVSVAVTVTRIVAVAVARVVTVAVTRVVTVTVTGVMVRMCVDGPAVYCVPQGAIARDGSIGVNRAVAVAAGVVDTAVGRVSGLGFLRKSGEGEDSDQDCHYGGECFSFHGTWGNWVHAVRRGVLGIIHLLAKNVENIEFS